MTTSIATRDGRPIAGWMLKANPDEYDAEGALGHFGVIDRWSLHTTYRVDLVEPGQRCFLYTGKGTTGRHPAAIIGVGVTVSEAYTMTGDDDGFYVDPDAPERHECFVEVEILPLQTPISREQLLSMPELAECELFTSSQQGNPSVLRPDELQAIEGLDLRTIAPTEEQLARLDAEHVPDFALIDGDRGYEVVLGEGEGEDWEWIVVRHEEDGESVELGRYPDFPDAVASLEEIASAVGHSAPIAPTEADAADAITVADPLAVFALEDEGVLSVIKSGDQNFDVYEVTVPDSDASPLVASYTDLGEAIADLALPEPEDP